MKLCSGVDLIEIGRVREAIERHGDRFLKRVFTPLELAEVQDDSASLAVRFAAKEAVAKALGTGIGVVCWQDIEIRRGPARQPRLCLHGAGRRTWVGGLVDQSEPHPIYCYRNGSSDRRMKILNP
jgi:holo-[acyl-carrier protein] synthase